ncbi:hypothetical protein NPS01_28630 [Nocardioides psychrotolerans]|nr:hypothetical protein NPS01_28630 [Nocardioides psychrotolerans]
MDGVKALIADLVPQRRLATAYGVFVAFQGVAAPTRRAYHDRTARSTRGALPRVARRQPVAPPSLACGDRTPGDCNGGPPTGPESAVMFP